MITVNLRYVIRRVLRGCQILAFVWGLVFFLGGDSQMAITCFLTQLFIAYIIADHDRKVAEARLSAYREGRGTVVNIGVPTRRRA